MAVVLVVSSTPETLKVVPNGAGLGGARRSGWRYR
jgi:hypothetical protein